MKARVRFVTKLFFSSFAMSVAFVRVFCGGARRQIRLQMTIGVASGNETRPRAPVVALALMRLRATAPWSERLECLIMVFRAGTLTPSSEACSVAARHLRCVIATLDRAGLVSGAGRLPVPANNRHTASKRFAFAHAPFWGVLDVSTRIFISMPEEKGLPVRVC